jgi:hypothetical protein
MRLLAQTWRPLDQQEQSPVWSACLRVTVPENGYTASMMSDQNIVAGILVGVGGGIVYGRWWAERRRAKEAMRKIWVARHDNRGDTRRWW